MLNEKKLQDHILSMEAAAKEMIREADKIRAMFEVKEPVKIEKGITKIEFRRIREKEMQRARNKKSLAIWANKALSNKILNH